MSNKKIFKIYEIWPTSLPWIPTLNFSREEMQKYDWSAISEMFGGLHSGDTTRPIDCNYLNAVEFTVNSKKMRFDFIPSYVSTPGNWLISKRAKLVLEDIGTKRVTYYPFLLNKVEFYLLVAPYHLTSIDISRSDKEFAQYDNFKHKYKKAVFIKKNLCDPTIFSGPLGFSTNFATETVKTAVQSAKLLGWQFVHCEKDEQNEKK